MFQLTMDAPLSFLLRLPFLAAQSSGAPGSDLRREAFLVDQVRNGEADRFEDLVRAEGPRAIRLAYRLVGNRADAEEIAQDAFLRFFAGIKKFRGECSVGTWIYRTVTRLAIDHLRRERLRHQLFFFRKEEDDAEPMDYVADTRPDPGECLIGAETGRRLAKAMQKLPSRQRAVFVLRHQEELPLKEIAGLLGLEEGTVKTHLHRAVARLRRELGE
jgi:RNA polymerase sigma-70 factor (ECF subfamily)